MPEQTGTEQRRELLPKHEYEHMQKQHHEGCRMAVQRLDQHSESRGIGAGTTGRATVSPDAARKRKSTPQHAPQQPAFQVTPPAPR